MSSGAFAATPIGAAVVEIRGSIEPLKLAISQARAITKDAEQQLGINVQLKLQPSQLRTQLQSALAGITVRVPVVLDMSGAQQQLARLGGIGSGMQIVPQSAMNGGGGGMLLTGGSMTSFPGGSRGMMIGGGASGLSASGSLALPAAAGMASAAGGGFRLGLGEKAFGFIRPMQGVMIAIGGAYAVDRAMQRDNQVIRTMQFEGADAAARQKLASIRGDMGGIGEAFRSGFVGFMQGGKHPPAFTRGLSTDAQQEQQFAEAVAGADIGKGMESNRAIIRRADMATLRAPLVGRAALDAQHADAVKTIQYTAAQESRAIKGSRATSADKTTALGSLASRSYSLVESENAQYLAELKKTDREVAAETRDSAREVTAIKSEAAMSNLRLTQGSVAAEKSALKTGLDAQVQQLKDAIATMQADGATAAQIAPTQARLAALQAAQPAIMAGQAAIQARASAQAANSIGAGTAAIGLQTQAITLSAGGRGRAALQKRRQAAYSQIRAGFVSQFQALEDKYGPAGARKSGEWAALEAKQKAELSRTAAEFDADEGRLNFGSQQLGIGNTARIASATMRMGQNDMGATLASFDADTKQKLAEMSGPGSTFTAADISGEMAARAAERQNIVADQTRTRANFKLGIGARIKSADLRGNGAPNAGRLVERFADMQQEISLAPEEFKAGLRNADIADLRAMRKDMLRPRQYAASFDPWHDVAGGPSGDAGNDTSKTLGQIAEYLKILVDQGRSDTGSAKYDSN